MTDEKIEEVIFDLINAHCDPDIRDAAVAWLRKRSEYYQAALMVGLIGTDEP